MKRSLTNMLSQVGKSSLRRAAALGKIVRSKYNRVFAVEKQTPVLSLETSEPSSFTEGLDKATEYLLRALVMLEKHLMEFPPAEGWQSKSGVLDDIAGLVFFTRKMRKHNEPRTVGFFGAQNRGKSSLINELLGLDLMPVAVTPMSSTAIYIKHDTSLERGCFNLSVQKVNWGHHFDKNLDLGDAQKTLIQYGSRKGTASFEDVDRIEVRSNLGDSDVLCKGGVLIDTPGAEKGFEDEKRNKNDIDKALKVLETAHVVIFVERADYLQGKSATKLFKENLSKMRPLCVVNFRDEYETENEADKDDEIRDKMHQNYGVQLQRTICVSAKEAKQAREGGNPLAGGLEDLVSAISKELQSLEPQQGIITCLQELEEILQMPGVKNWQGHGKEKLQMHNLSFLAKSLEENRFSEEERKIADQISVLAEKIEDLL